MKLPRLEKKPRVTVRWTLDVMFERDLAQYITRGAVDTVNRAKDVGPMHMGRRSYRSLAFLG